MTDNKRIVDVIADALEMHINNTVKDNSYITSMNAELSEHQRSEVEEIIQDVVSEYADSIIDERISNWMDENLHDRIAGRINITFD